MNFYFCCLLFWFIVMVKKILFWLYLWQLKDYHIGRFLDHFQTEKGKKTLFNRQIFLKVFWALLFPLSYFFLSAAFGNSLEGSIIWALPIQYLPLEPELFIGFFYASLFVFLSFYPIVFAVYFFESVFTLFAFYQRKIRQPVLTAKTVVLTALAAFVVPGLLLLVYFIRGKDNSFNWWLPFWLLVIDSLIPLIVSLVVLSFQPLAALGRNQIIKRAKEKRAVFHNLLVIGITGSYGKTSTKEFLYTILVEKFGAEKVLKTKEHQNSEVGISQCILNDLKPGHEVFICEMGAYGLGGIKLLCDIAKPKIGILTGINEQHMATFGSQENIIRAKYELIEALPKDGLAIFNGDNEYCFELYKKTRKPKKFYSLQSSIFNAQPDLWATSLAVNRQFLSFETFDKNGELTVIKANVMGGQNVYNILAAA